MKKVTFLLQVILLPFNLYCQTTNISGNINSYALITQITNCPQSIIVDSPSLFTAGDLVMLYQSKGATISTTNSNQFGNILSYNNAGLYEWNRISSISGNTIFLQYNLVYTYSPSSGLQLIKVKEIIGNANVNAIINTPTYLNGKGGVTALKCSGSLTLNANINANFSGFERGIYPALTSSCTFITAFTDYFYPSGDWRGAEKGEGISVPLTGQENGRGKQANGGGGGNDHNSGGGGGGNGGNGGQGGTNNEPSLGGCDGFYPGLGGISLNYNTNALFLGGGGGSGHCNNTPTQGGNGGGLVIIDCNSIEGNGFSINSNGQNGGVATNDGASGAGAGGTILINTNSWGTSNLFLNANGGNGGNTINLANRCYGPGGGGGGGAVLSNTPLTSNIIPSFLPGNNGIITNSTNVCNGSSQGASPGTSGIQLNNKTIVSGFLPSPPNATITLDPISDTVCSGQPLFFASSAIGSGLNYQWQVNAGFGFINLLNSATYNGAFDDTLFITNTNVTFNNYIFRVIVTDVCGLSDTSNSATLTVLQQPFATAITPDTLVCNNSIVNLSASIFGNANTQQWQILNSGIGFSNLNNTSTYNGVQTTSLSISPFTSSISPSVYRFSVSNTCGTNYSDSITVSIHPLPLITSNPTNDTICSGGNASFFAVANNASLLNWQIFNPPNWIDLSNNGTYQNVTTQSLSINNLSNFNFQYRLKAINSCGDSIFSNIVSVVESNSPIMILNNPVNDTACFGESLNLSVLASGSGLTYQWQVDNGSGFTNISNNATYSGANSPNLNIINSSSAISSYSYRAIATNNCGNSINSLSAIVIVNEPPIISSSLNDIYYCNNDTFNIQILGSGNPVSFQWQVNTGSGFTNLLNNFIYKNTQTNSLQICGAAPSLNNSQYRVLVMNECDTLISNISTIILRPSAIISSQPLDVFGCPGSSTNFNVTASNVLSYQWQILQLGTWTNLSNNPPYSGVLTNSLLVSQLSSITDSFRVIVTDSCNTQTISNSAGIIPQNNITINSSPLSLQMCENSSQLFTINASGNALTYQWQIDMGSGFTNLTDNVSVNGSNNDSLIISNISMGQNGSIFRVIISDACNQSDTSLSFVLTVIQNPSINLIFTDSTICESSSISIPTTSTGNYNSYQWQFLSGGTFSDVNNNTNFNGSSTSHLDIVNAPNIFNNSTYRLIGYNTICGNDTTQLFNLNVTPIPAITSTLADTSICSSSPLVNSVSVSNTNIVSYQWQFNSGSGFTSFVDGINVNGSQSNQLTLNSSNTLQNNTLIRVVVYGNCGNDTSNYQNVQLISSPLINSQPQNTNACPNGNASFSVSTNGNSFQWQINSGTGFSNLSNNSNFTGVQTQNLSISNIPTSMFADSFRCLIINNCGDSIYTETVKLIINSSQIIQQPTNAYVCPYENTSFSVYLSNFNTLQWQISEDGINYSNIINNNTFSGNQTQNLSINGALPTMDSSFFRIIATDLCNQPVSGIQEVQLILNPVIDISNLFNDTTTCTNNLLEISIPSYVSGITQAVWSNGQTGNSLQIKNNIPTTEEFMLSVTNNLNCTSSDTFNISFEDCKNICNPIIPTAFSPNKDGKNDIFRPIFKCNIKDFQMKIFNRWGEKIFETSSQNSGWDGIYKNESCELGVYMFTIDYNTTDNNPKTVSGQLTLIR